MAGGSGWERGVAGEGAWLVVVVGGSKGEYEYLHVLCRQSPAYC